MGTISAHLDDETEQRARLAAKEKSRGSMSAYIGELVRRDIEGGVASIPNPSEENCLLMLARSFTPFIAPDIAKLVAGQDQKKILASILISYAGGDYSDPNSMQLSPEFKKAIKGRKVAK